MMLASYSVLPESMLAPSQLYQKFSHVSGLKGLGCTDSITLQDGSSLCLDVTVDPTDYSSAAGPSVYQCPDGGYTTGSCNPSGSSSSSSGLTPQQQALLGSQIAGGAFDIAKLLAIQPGTVQTGAGTSRQTTGYPISSLGLGTNLSTSGISSTTMLMLAAVAAVVVIGMKGGGR